MTLPVISVSWRSLDKDKVAIRLAELEGLKLGRKQQLEHLSKEFNCNEITRGKLERIEKTPVYIQATEERVNKILRASRSIVKTALSEMTPLFLTALKAMLIDCNPQGVAQFSKIMGFDVAEEKKDQDQTLNIVMAGNFAVPKQTEPETEVVDVTETHD